MSSITVPPDDDYQTVVRALRKLADAWVRETTPDVTPGEMSAAGIAIARLAVAAGVEPHRLLDDSTAGGIR